MIEREIAEFGRRMGMPAFFPFPLRGSPRSTWSAPRALHLEACRKRRGARYARLPRAGVPEYDGKPHAACSSSAITGTPIPCRCPGGVRKGYVSFSPVSPNGRRRRRASKEPSSSSAASWIPSPKPDSATSVFFTGKDSHAEHQPSGSFPRHPDHHGKPGGNAAASPGRPLASMSCARPRRGNLSPCNAHHLVEQALCPDAGDATSSAGGVFPATSRDAWKPLEGVPMIRRPGAGRRRTGPASKTKGTPQRLHGPDDRG